MSCIQGRWAYNIVPVINDSVANVDFCSFQKSPRCSYYGLFDGHGGVEAATYSVAHLAYHLRNSIYYPDDPARAITDAFTSTDKAIISKYHTDVSELI